MKIIALCFQVFLRNLLMSGKNTNFSESYIRNHVEFFLKEKKLCRIHPAIAAFTWQQITSKNESIQNANFFISQPNPVM